MFEILVAALIAAAAIYIIVKSFKNSSKGKCNCGCSKCNFKSKCSENSDEK
ncbi:MAG: FeoB-associated Cys-rich membrane protein [Clostridium sp.]